MNTRAKIAGLMMACMVLSVPMAYAEKDKDMGMDMGMMRGPGHHEGWGHGDKDQMMKEVLGLSDGQVKQIDGILKKQKETQKSDSEQIKSNKEDLEAEIVKAAPDMNKINGIEAQIKTQLSQMVDNRFNSIFEIKKIMTPEQFAGYMALKKEKSLMMHKMKMHRMMGNKGCALKDCDMHKHGDNKPDKDHETDD